VRWLIGGHTCSRRQNVFLPLPVAERKQGIHESKEYILAFTLLCHVIPLPSTARSHAHGLWHSLKAHPHNPSSSCLIGRRSEVDSARRTLAPVQQYKVQNNCSIFSVHRATWGERFWFPAWSSS
jgi:hypothetical protein